MLRRNTINFMIDLAAFLAFMAILATGLMMRYALPPGSSGRGGGTTLSLWGMSRHGWGDVHFWLAVGMGALVLIHLVLHWGWVLGTMKRAVAQGAKGAAVTTATGRVLGATVFLALLLVGVIGFTNLAVTRTTLTSANRHSAVADESQDQSEASPALVAGDETGIDAHADDPFHDVIRGSMTLEEVAAVTGASVDALKQSLNLPAAVHPDERLGRLRREFGFTLHDVRTAAAKHVGSPALAP